MKIFKMDKNLLKKLKNCLPFKKQEKPEVQEKKEEIQNQNKNKIKVLDKEPDFQVQKEEIKKPVKVKKEIKTPVKVTKPKVKPGIEKNKNKIPVLDTKEDLLNAFSNSDFRVKEGRKVRPEPKKIKIEPVGIKQTDKNKNGIKVLDDASSLDSLFLEDAAETSRKQQKLRTESAMLKAKKGGEQPKKISLQKRLERYPSPEQSLDLHGFTGIQAKLKSEHFIRNSHANGYFTLRIITGKGLHSENGAVLPDIVENLVFSLKSEGIILSFKWEKKRKEKSGSMIIYLNRFDEPPVTP